MSRSNPCEDWQAELDPAKDGFDPELVYRSSPTLDIYFPNILRNLFPTESDSIIDIGCGKGWAMRLMMEFPFKQIAGVEISERIANIAKNNFVSLKDNRCIVYAGDATEFPSYHSFNYLYLYNPFPAQVMVKVIDKINQSLHESSKEKKIIYNNPLSHEVLTQRGWFEIRKYRVEYTNELYIYSRKEGAK